MKRSVGLVMVLTASVLAGACAPMAMYGPMAGSALARRAPRAPYEPSPIGRWDSVMSLGPNAVVEVLDAEGRTHVAQFVRASVVALMLVENGEPASMPRAEVVRVTLLPSRKADAVKEVVTGAAGGAAAAGVGVALIPYLFTGRVWLPPARIWGVGAVAGAADALGKQKAEQHPRTVYVAALDRMY